MILLVISVVLAFIGGSITSAVADNDYRLLGVIGALIIFASGVISGINISA